MCCFKISEKINRVLRSLLVSTTDNRNVSFFYLLSQVLLARLSLESRISDTCLINEHDLISNVEVMLYSQHPPAL